MAAGAYIKRENDPQNAGVFTLAEGATLRQHTPGWMAHFTWAFALVQEMHVPVFTMNGNRSQAFQLSARKPIG